MAGDVVNIKVCAPFKLCGDLSGKYHAIYHYSYNLPYAITHSIFIFTFCNIKTN